MKKHSLGEGGFTLVELAIGLIVFAVVALGFFTLFISLVNSALVAKKISVASALATNQMEYLKSLPYDSLAIAGGNISSSSPLPATTTKTVDGIKYTLTTSINYVDDAYDGCGPYPNNTLKQLYCRNYPPPTGAPSPDQNPQDYKIAHVAVTDSSGAQLAQVDTQIAARVSETASATGALFVSVLDSNGSPVSDATVTVTNATLSPNINVSDSTDTNGIAIFYGLKPDNGNDYVVTATKSGYSSLTTIAPSGSLQPTYPNQNIITQQSSYVTLTIKKQGTNSLLVETTDTNGNVLPNVKTYIKGGYKKYTSTSNTAYYYDNMSPSDSRPITDSDGLAGINNLVPGDYIFCGDNGSTGCSVGGTTYYLAAAVPYSSANSFNPITVPIYDPSNPPTTTYPYNSAAYLQKVRLMLTTNVNFPRIATLSPSDVSLTGGTIGSFTFTISGSNLPCSSSSSSCGTTVKFKQASNTYTASCTGTGNTQLNCSVNLTGATTGNMQLEIDANGYTFLLPDSPLLGGLSVTP